MTESEYINAICEKIRNVRLSKGIKQIEVAYSCGIDRSNIRRIEAGRTAPTISTICRIASALNVPVKELLPDGFPEYWMYNNTPITPIFSYSKIKNKNLN